MNISEAIAARRSIRDFTKAEVTDEDVKEFLSAGMNAPSARNTQPWHFIVIRDRDTINSIVEVCPNGSMLKKAPMAVLVLGDLNLTDDYWVVDCSAAVQNILLAAEAGGLGACWVGVYPRQPRIDGLKKLFSLPEEIMPHSLIAIGHPAEKKKPNNNYKKERVRYEKWN
jgi:nitroreductase